MELNEGILDVGAIAEAAFRMVKSHAETGGIELTRALDPHLSGLFADERKVKQIVLNLLTNAVKFTPEGGRVSLEARLEDDAMALVVADTGVGMNEDSLTKALTKFGQVNSQLSRNNQGTGPWPTLGQGLDGGPRRDAGADKRNRRGDDGDGTVPQRCQRRREYVPARRRKNVPRARW